MSSPNGISSRSSDKQKQISPLRYGMTRFASSLLPLLSFPKGICFWAGDTPEPPVAKGRTPAPYQPGSQPQASNAATGRGLKPRSIGIALTLVVATAAARADLPAWLQHIAAATQAEAALYRAMQLPGAMPLYPRPPREATEELAKLAPTSELYALKAQSEEAALDPQAAEADWKLHASTAKDPVQATLALADFYHRRLDSAKELAALTTVASAPKLDSGRLLDPARQRSWQAFDRILTLEADQALPPAQTESTYDAFLTRYPDQPVVYARAFTWLVAQKQYPAAEALIPRFTRQFPQDKAFPIRAEAALAEARGNSDAAPAVYDRAFEPLWPDDLSRSYLALLAERHQQRTFEAQARAQLAQHPTGPQALNALARIVIYQQQSGQTDATQQAQQTLDRFRIARESRGQTWTAIDLYTLAGLERTNQNDAEVARYDFALASLNETLPDGEPAAQAGLAGLVDVLLTAPVAAA